MSVLSYTSADQIRALLGVSIDELPDSVVELEVYDTGLLNDLMEISPTIGLEYQTLLDGDIDSLTPLQSLLFKGVRAYATYCTARRVAIGMPMFGPKDITDGKAGVVRFAGTPYLDTLAAIESELSRTKQRLIVVYKSFNPSVSSVPPRVYANAVPLLFNPVTGS